MAAAASEPPEKGPKPAAVRLSSSICAAASAAACFSRASGLPSLYSSGCAAPNTGAYRNAVTGRSVYLSSLSAFAFCMRRENGEWLLLEVAPTNTTALAANRGPHISVQRRASATMSSRCEPSFTTSRAPCAFSAVHSSAAVSSEASSHARLNTSFAAAKGQKGATAGSSEPGAREVLPGWPGPKRPPHESIPPGNLRTKALWPDPTRDFLVCAHALVARSVFGYHPGSSWKGGDTSRGGENRRLVQMA